MVTGWHSHDLHQIEDAIGGVVEVETSAHYLLPARQAAFSRAFARCCGETPSSCRRRVSAGPL